MVVAAESSTTSKGTAASSPVVVDIGKKPKKQIKQLREGRGKLMDEVTRVIAELQSTGSVSASAQPVVVVVRQKPKSRSILWPLA